MKREEIKELHYITHLDNVPTILQRGILSHQAGQRVPHKSVADEEVQSRRAARAIPGGLRLHQYANLYFNARNAMMYRITGQMGIPREQLAVLRIADTVLDRSGVVITEINAAADVSPLWHTVREGLPMLDVATIYAHSWNHADLLEKQHHKQRMMAEALVPNRVPPGYIAGAYVVSEDVARVLSQSAPTMGVMVLPCMFFQGSQPGSLPYLPAGGVDR